MNAGSVVIGKPGIGWPCLEYALGRGKVQAGYQADAWPVQGQCIPGTCSDYGPSEIQVSVECITKTKQGSRSCTTRTRPAIARLAVRPGLRGAWPGLVARNKRNVIAKESHQTCRRGNVQTGQGEHRVQYLPLILN